VLLLAALPCPSTFRGCMGMASAKMGKHAARGNGCIPCDLALALIIRGALIIWGDKNQIIIQKERPDGTLGPRPPLKTRLWEDSEQNPPAKMRRKSPREAESPKIRRARWRRRGKSKIHRMEAH